MRRVFVGIAAACLAATAGGAQEVEYADAVSRQVLLVNTEGDPAAAGAISRQVLLRTENLVTMADAVSRQMVLLNAETDVEYDDAVSREVMLLLPPYDIDDVRQALHLLAGLLEASSSDLDRLDIERSGGSASTLDMRDAARITRMAMGLDP